MRTCISIEYTVMPHFTSLKVLFHVINLQTTLPTFSDSEFSVQREHEEFVWLHTMYVENDEYGGIVVSCFLYL